MEGESLYQMACLLKKFPWEGDASLRRAAAIAKIEAAENKCSWFNTRGYKVLLPEGKEDRFLTMCKEFILRVIGDEPNFEEVSMDARHGPGADTDSHGKTTVYDKYSGWPYLATRSASGYAQRLIQQDERWFGALEDSYRRRNHIEMWRILDREAFWDSVIRPCEGNRITTVPKDDQTDRPIAIEPRLNLMLQLGVDGFIRRNLKRWGIDLDSQVKNQDLALLGSVCSDADTPVTIDLSNASDTISLRCVKLLFPKAWYEYLTAIRSPRGELPDGRTMKYSRFASMGNGCTFAIESLVFASVVYAASMYTYGRWYRDRVAVFGDDIIVPQAMCHLTTTLLEAFGFSLNKAKCFTHGDRRESCGTDWIRGTDVRPVFLTKQVISVADLYYVRNALSRWMARRGIESTNVDRYIEKYIPKHQLCYGPLSDTDFDSYWHTSDRSHGSYHGERPWSWQFYSIQRRSVTNAAEEFLFRKLMATLSTTPQKNQYSTHAYTLHVLSGGSIFDVVQSCTKYIKSKRWLPNWQTSYSPRKVRS